LARQILKVPDVRFGMGGHHWLFRLLCRFCNIFARRLYIEADGEKAWKGG